MSTAPFSVEDADARHLRTLSDAELEDETVTRMLRFEKAFETANPDATVTFEIYNSDPRLRRALDEHHRREAQEER